TVVVNRALFFPTASSRVLPSKPSVSSIALERPATSSTVRVHASAREYQAVALVSETGANTRPERGSQRSSSRAWNCAAGSLADLMGLPSLGLRPRGRSFSDAQ